MEIRFAREQDIPGMIALLKQVGEVHHRIRPDLFREGAQKYNEGDLDRLLSDPARPIFVAAEGETVLGYCFCILRITRDDPVLCDDRTLYIDDLCVEETCRGQHVGRQLYDHTVAWARAQRFDRILLNVWCGNDGAMAFYEKRGMTPRNIYMEQILEDRPC